MISIDPGEDCFWACWRDCHLVECGPWPTYRCVDRHEYAVIEDQVILPKFTKNPASIIHLAHMAGAVASQFNWPDEPMRVKWVKPRAWKGNTKKPTAAKHWASYAIHRAVIEALTPAEIAIYTVQLEKLPPGERHNLADALGIGLHELGRMPAPRTVSPKRKARMAALQATLIRQAS